MYSGSTFTKISGSIFGAHQKIDRIARRELDHSLPNNAFPSIKDILKFEGHQGPDSLKRKSPGGEEEWHFIQPFDLRDNRLLNLIEDHYNELVKALVSGNKERSAFEAAWLAHAVVDGLTPAHHYPYEQQMIELRQGEANATRSTIKKKLVMTGEGGLSTIKNNWKMWGPKGLFTTHASFELGFASLIAPMSFYGLDSSSYVRSINQSKLSHWFRLLAQQVDKLNIYETFYKKGWTIKLARQLRASLAPMLINAVTAIWQSAYVDSLAIKNDQWSLQKER